MNRLLPMLLRSFVIVLIAVPNEGVINIGGNIRIAGIFNVHTQGNLGKGYWKRCGMIDPQYGMMFVEAMLFAMDRINSNSSFLYGLKLAARIHDTCGDRRYQRNALVDIARYSSQGVIGPQYSDDAKTAATVFEIFGKTVISYSATSPDLSDRMKYSNFFRTVPSDEEVTKLLVNIAIRFNWTYVAVLRSVGNYGERASDLFRDMAQDHNICTPVDLQIEDNMDAISYSLILNVIMHYPTIKVVYLFLTDTHLREFFKFAENLKDQAGYLNFVVSDGWGSRISIAQGNTLANGSLTIQIDQDEVKEFRDYYLKLRPETNKRNVWFKQFWEQQFNCSIQNDSSKAKVCSGEEKITEGQGYYGRTPILTVINAVYAYAHVFRKIIEDRCLTQNKTAKNCFRQGLLTRLTNYRDIYNNLRVVRFKEPFRDKIFQFNKKGERIEGFRIWNFYMRYSDKKQQYTSVGRWNITITEKNAVKIRSNAYTTDPWPLETWRLKLEAGRIVWKDGLSKPPISVCSKQCKFGEVKKLINDKSTCCWTCIKCSDNDLIKNNTCKSCDMSHVPDSSRQHCLKLPVQYLGMNVDFKATVSTCASVGLLLTLTVAFLLIKNFNKRTARASGRELCLIMLTGIACTYVTPIAFILRPSDLVCKLHRFTVGLSLTISYAPLLLKVNRIYRIFRSAKFTVERPVMISPRSQILMSVALTAIEILISIVSISGTMPIIKNAYPSHRKCTLIFCELSSVTVFINLSYSSALMLATTWFAFKTRNFPKNYNEAKYIGFTMYATCLVLAVFLPTFYFVNDAEGKNRIIVTCCMCHTIATINLFGLFGPKVKRILNDDARLADTNMTINSTIVMNHVQRIGVSAERQASERDN